MTAAPSGEDRRTAGTLYVVATPIGNLADITLRAIEILRAVPLVAAEDTRLTRRLFARHEIDTRLISFHARSGPGRLAELLDRLRSGSDVALVTDAGTPVVSDPGEELVRAWAEEGGRIVPIPGPSAILAAIVSSGIAGPRWSFDGFLPRSGRARRQRMARIAADERGTIVFEAPNRVADTLADLAAACGGERLGAVCRELTKIHETTTRGTLAALAGAAASGAIPPRGEFVIVIGSIEAAGERSGHETAAGERLTEPEGSAEIAAARAEVEGLVAAGHPRGEAARLVSARTGVPRRRIYGTPDAGAVGDTSSSDDRQDDGQGEGR